MKNRTTLLLLCFGLLLGLHSFAQAQVPPAPAGGPNNPRMGGNRPLPPGMMPPGMVPPGGATAPAAAPAPTTPVMPLMPDVDTITLDDLKDKMTATPDPMFSYQSRMLQLELRGLAEKQLLEVSAARQSATSPKNP